MIDPRDFGRLESKVDYISSTLEGYRNDSNEWREKFDGRMRNLEASHAQSDGAKDERRTKSTLHNGVIAAVTGGVTAAFLSWVQRHFS
jgi:hypothetical protein